MNRWHRDYGQEARMLMTMFMLASVSLLFRQTCVMGRDRGIVNEHEAPQLHQMISKPCTTAPIEERIHALEEMERGT